ncbi:MAG: hypothetical protein NC250_01125 [Alistipes senegalensis]|nr:hypothetical protein [Bacteroides cellulosilyticus]MCM1351320.1 hypothetical protein [Alistipes senegalensis]
MKRIIFLLSALLAIACQEKTYEIAEPEPTLTVEALQNTCTLDETAYIQVAVSQRGYDGRFLLSVLVDEGRCELRMNGTSIATDGSWIQLSQPTEMLALTPRETGRLRLTLEACTAEGTRTARSRLNLPVSGSPELGFTAEAPTTASIANPIAITMTVEKAGFAGQLPVKFVQETGTGSLQFGAFPVASDETFSCPANAEQTLYYTAAERGQHRLQFSVNDGYATRFASVEIIVTK